MSGKGRTETNGDPHPGDRRDVRQGIRRADGPPVLQGHAHRGDAAARPLRGAGGRRDGHDAGQSRDDAARPGHDLDAVPGGLREVDRRHARHGHDGGDGPGPRRGSNRQVDRPHGRHGAVGVRQLRRSLQSRERAVLRPAPARRRLRRDERPLLFVGQRPEGPGAGHLREDRAVGHSAKASVRPQNGAMSKALTSPFASLGLDARLVSALVALGYEEPTPIQSAAIPPLIEGRDVFGQAATGTGKTAAFALPILNAMPALSERGVAPSALILVPTRELAMQLAESVHKYGREMNVRVLPVYGGASMETQLRALKRGVDVVVATPGRALDHVNRRSLALGSLRTLVLDEADEMLDMGFAEDLDAILAATPKTRQTALFSATLPPRIATLASRHLREPVRIEIEKEKTAPGKMPKVRQTAYVVARGHKRAALGRILDRPSAARLWPRATTYAVCRTLGIFPGAVFSFSISIRTGSRRWRDARVAMRGGSVAENSAVWRVFGVAARIASRSSAKPMSSISSASSRTSVRRLPRASERRFTWSSARPGVATTTSTPRFRALSCVSIDAPP